VERSRLRAYRHHASLELNDRARSLDDRLREEGESLIPRLYALVPRLCRTVRRSVLAAQRAVYNRAPLPDGPWLKAVERTDPLLAQALVAWGALQSEQRSVIAARDRRFEADVEACDAALLALCRDPHFQRGLELANPSLSRELARAGAGDSSKRARRALARGMRYLLRAALRPTPLSFFCSTAVVPYHPGAAAQPSFTERFSHLQLNRELATGVFASLLQRSRLRMVSTVRPAPLSYADADGIWACNPAGDYAAVDPALYRRVARLPEAGIAWAHSGLTDAETDAALSVGLLACDWGISNEHADDFDVLLRLIWEHGWTDVEALALLPLLETLRSEFARAADRVHRRGALARLRQCAAMLPKVTADAPPPIFEDTWCAPPPLPDLMPFLEEIAHFGAALLWPRLLPEEEALSGLFRRFADGATELPLLSFHRRYLDLCRALQLGPEHWTNSPHLCRWLGIDPIDPVAALRTRLEHAMADGVDEVRSPWEPCELGQWELARSVRLSLRFAAASGGRFHPVFWGGEAMSLLPRYARLPFPGVDLTQAVRAWMTQWPNLADIYGALGRNVNLRPRVTGRIIESPCARPDLDAIRLRELIVRLDEESGRLILVDGRGWQVSPIFLGVSSLNTLPAIHQLLVHLCGRRASFFELALRAVGQLVSERVHLAPQELIRLPQVLLGTRIVLSGVSFVVPGRALPSLSRRFDREDFFRFHDWLAANGLPRLAQVWVPGRPPMWVDFGHPIGVRSLVLFVRNAASFLLRPPLLDGEAAASMPKCGFETEYYVELAAGTNGDD
jgi:hypothetical protein